MEGIQIQAQQGLGSGRDDVWAVGNGGSILHYNGQVPGRPFPSGVTGTLYGVWGSGPADVWFVGE